MNRDYEMLRNNSPTTITHYNSTGTAMSVAANRISFVFNLTGPSFTVDSACSSSLVALHVACQAIKQGKKCMEDVSILDLLKVVHSSYIGIFTIIVVTTELLRE